MEAPVPREAIEPADGSRRAEAARIARLAAPVVVAYLGTVAMGVVDTIMVGRLGAGALAAVALANTWTFGLVIVALGAARALDPIVAQAHGRGDRRTVGLGFSLGLAMGMLLAPPVMVALAFAAPALSLLGQPQELLQPAGAYCRALIWGVPGLLGFAVCRQYMQALGRMRQSASSRGWRRPDCPGPTGRTGSHSECSPETARHPCSRNDIARDRVA